MTGYGLGDDADVDVDCGEQDRSLRIYGLIEATGTKLKVEPVLTEFMSLSQVEKRRVKCLSENPSDF